MQEDLHHEDAKKKGSFLIKLLSAIEKFDLSIFKKQRAKAKEEKNQKLEKKKELKQSSVTIDAMAKQRSDHVKKVVIRIFLLGFIIVLISGAVILSLQDNEYVERANTPVQQIIRDDTSFGKIDQKDYFLEQNILDDKIAAVDKKAQEGRKNLEKKVIEQTGIIKEHISKVLQEQTKQQDKKLQEVKKDILKTVDQKIAQSDAKKDSLGKKLEKIKAELKEQIAKAPTTNTPKRRLGLKNGTIIFPNTSNTTSGTNRNRPQKKGGNLVYPPKEEVEMQIVEEEVTVEEDIAISSKDILQTNYSTIAYVDKTPKKFKPFTIDLVTSMARVTLLNGVQAPTLDVGVSNPSPVLMIVEDILYTANDHIADLKGCFLRGAAVGNINTSRVEIFGTHLSCVIETEDGKKYKIEETFANNQIWIKGEDGGDGLQGVIVDSSGKILSKSAALGFMQGLTNYFSAQNMRLNGSLQFSGNGGLSATQQLNNTLASGASTAASSSFKLIIQQYQKLLGGYYPFIDVKGGRKNLTAVFAGNMKLTVNEYVEPNIEEMIENNMALGYKQEKQTVGGK